jgi:hypothetical protein
MSLGDLIKNQDLGNAIAAFRQNGFLSCLQNMGSTDLDRIDHGQK